MKKILLIILFIGIWISSSGQAYLGYVTNTVNFRTQPNTSSDVIRTLKPNTTLFVVSNSKFDGYYQVLNIETNEEGYVHSNYVQLDRQLPRNEAGIFTPVGKSDASDPSLRIHNNTNLTLTLRLNDRLYSFYPQERKTLSLKAGRYTYRASAPGVLPDYGNESMLSNYEYEWSFYISSY
jgi:uncharacterized protein YgiM (DUF1202 family)